MFRLAVPFLLNDPRSLSQLSSRPFTTHPTLLFSLPFACIALFYRPYDSVFSRSELLRRLAARSRVVIFFTRASEGNPPDHLSSEGGLWTEPGWEQGGGAVRTSGLRTWRGKKRPFLLNHHFLSFASSSHFLIMSLANNRTLSILKNASEGNYGGRGFSPILFLLFSWSNLPFLPFHYLQVVAMNV